jgi:hypothetical protein
MLASDIPERTLVSDFSKKRREEGLRRDTPKVKAWKRIDSGKLQDDACSVTDRALVFHFHVKQSGGRGV